jgi:hypothetical protein
MNVIASPLEIKIFEQQVALKEQQLAQKSALTGGKALPEITANRDKSKKIKEKDKDYVHVEVLTRTLNASGTDFHNERRVLKLNPRAFEQLIKDNGFAQYNESKVIHDPRENAPKEVKLVAAPLQAAPGLVNDAELAAREQKVADREKSIDDKLAQLDAKLAELNKAKVTPVKQQPPVQTKEPVKTDTKATNDLPNLDDLSQGEGK